jgi:hypothetical protein
VQRFNDASSAALLLAQVLAQVPLAKQQLLKGAAWGGGSTAPTAASAGASPQ